MGEPQENARTRESALNELLADYSTGICDDGTCFLKNGEAMTIDELLNELRAGNKNSYGVIEKQFQDRLKVEVDFILSNLDYALFNLAEKTEDDVEEGVIDSTCPETSLIIAIRRLRMMQS